MNPDTQRRLLSQVILSAVERVDADRAVLKAQRRKAAREYATNRVALSMGWFTSPGGRLVVEAAGLDADVVLARMRGRK